MGKLSDIFKDIVGTVHDAVNPFIQDMSEKADTAINSAMEKCDGVLDEKQINAEIYNDIRLSENTADDVLSQLGAVQTVEVDTPKTEDGVSKIDMDDVENLF